MRNLPVCAVLLFTACTAPTDDRASLDRAAEPWTLAEARYDASNGIRVLVVHDMEGLVDQTNPSTYIFGRPEYGHGQELLAADLNAVIDGLYAGGATELHVVDGHGSGNPEPDVRSDLLDERALQIIRQEPFDTYFDLVTLDAYDAVAVVGMHAKSQSGGYAAHTWTLGMEFIINGSSITETELLGLSWGRARIPVIFASGDDKLRENLESMPWIEYVTVKTAVHPDYAVLRPADEARADLTAGASRAVRKLLTGEAMAMEVATPITVEFGARPPASVAILEGVPGVQFNDSRVMFVADSMRQAFDGLQALSNVATRHYAGLLFETVASRSDGAEILDAFNRALERRWFEVESGQYQEPRREPPPGMKHHGYH